MRFLKIKISCNQLNVHWKQCPFIQVLQSYTQTKYFWLCYETDIILLIRKFSLFQKVLLHRLFDFFHPDWADLDETLVFSYKTVHLKSPYCSSEKLDLGKVTLWYKVKLLFLIMAHSEKRKRMRDKNTVSDESSGCLWLMYYFSDRSHSFLTSVLLCVYCTVKV